MAGRAWWAMIVLLACGAGGAHAIAPIVSGDVPTAPRGVCELFVGYVLNDDGGVRTHEAPFGELVCGVTARQELKIEAPILLRDRTGGTSAGPGDTVVGTKVRLIGDPAEDSGLIVSADIKIPSGDSYRGLGSGGADVDLRLRGGFRIGPGVVYGNLGRTWVGERRGEKLDDTWFQAVVWDHPAAPRVRVLAEIYRKSAADPGSPARLAATCGLRWKVRPARQAHFSAGRSLRSGAEGGPTLRINAGWRWDV